MGSCCVTGFSKESWVLFFLQLSLFTHSLTSYFKSFYRVSTHWGTETSNDHKVGYKEKVKRKLVVRDDVPPQVSNKYDVLLCGIPPSGDRLTAPLVKRKRSNLGSTTETKKIENVSLSSFTLTDLVDFWYWVKTSSWKSSIKWWI